MSNLVDVLFLLTLTSKHPVIRQGGPHSQPPRPTCLDVKEGSVADRFGDKTVFTKLTVATDPFVQTVRGTILAPLPFEIG